MSQIHQILGLLKSALWLDFEVSGAILLPLLFKPLGVVSWSLAYKRFWLKHIYEDLKVSCKNGNPLKTFWTGIIILTFVLR